MIKAVIFDFDGLIVDTETPWYEAYKAVFKQYDVDLPLEVWGKCIGTSFHVFNPLDYLEQHANCSISRDAINQEAEMQHSNLMKYQTIRPGVKNYLREAKELGLKIGLASSSSRSWVESYLNTFEVIEFFDTVHTSDDVSQVKPNPELYIKSLKALQVYGDEAIAFEDSLNGLTAAKEAGAFCVIVPNSVTTLMEFMNYDLRIKSMDEMPLIDVISTILSKQEG
jgi:putative hydrolase of the HAD superfamily